jgi:hypothetical protein
MRLAEVYGKAILTTASTLSTLLSRFLRINVKQELQRKVMQESRQCLAVARPGLKVKRNVSWTPSAPPKEEDLTILIDSGIVRQGGYR